MSIFIFQDNIPSSTSFDLLADLATPSTTSNDPFQSDLYATVDKNRDAPVDFFADNTNKPAPETKPQTAGNGSEEEALLMNDPFAELKKNINQMHDQNEMQRQQQQQQMFMGGYHVSQQPANNMMTQQQNQHNPFATNQFGATKQAYPNQNGFPPQQQQFQGGYNAQHPPTARPSANPFMQIAAPLPTPQDDMGWTLDKPLAPTNVTKSPQTTTYNNQGADPFAFLDHQTTPNGNVNGQTTVQQNASAGHSTNASDELLDFLG